MFGTGLRLDNLYFDEDKAKVRVIEMNDKEHSELCEKLADLAHRQWSGWMTYMLGKCDKGIG